MGATQKLMKYVCRYSLTDHVSSPDPFEGKSKSYDSNLSTLLFYVHSVEVKYSFSEW